MAKNSSVETKSKAKATSKGRPALKSIKPQVTRPGHEFVIPLEVDTDTDYVRLELAEHLDGAVIDEERREFRWTPSRDSLGPNEFTVNATDSNGGVSAMTMEIMVEDNQAPTITPIPNRTIPVGQAFSQQVQANDPEGETLSYSFVNPTSSLMIDPNTGLITGTPSTPETISVAVQVTDPHGAFATESFDLTVTNQAPTITPIPNQTIPVGQAFSQQVQANDPEGETLFYSFVNPTSSLMIDPNTGLITGTPSSPETISVAVQVTDPHGAFATESFDLTVTNQAPTITPIPNQTISVGQAFSQQVQANDPEGETLSYGFVNPVFDLMIEPNTGLISGTPNSTGTISVAVQVTDPHGAFTTESFDLTVTNQAPTIAAIPNQTISVGQAFSQQVQANDPEGQTLAYSFVNPVFDLMIEPNTGLISGTPNSTGTISVTVQVTDPYGAFATESFDLTVTNQAPTIAAIANQSIPIGQAFSQQVQASDPEGQPLSYSFVNPVFDLMIDANTGLITGTPMSPGTISVVVQVIDPYGAFAIESFDLTVTNQAPTITPIPNQTITVGQVFSQQVQASDPEGQPLSYSFANAVFDLMIDGTTGLITGTPPTPGTISVVVQVTDPYNAFATESFDLTVT